MFYSILDQVVTVFKYIFSFIYQAFVHKVVMDELKRIIEDSEVCDAFLSSLIFPIHMYFLWSLKNQSIKSLCDACFL